MRKWRAWEAAEFSHVSAVRTWILLSPPSPLNPLKSTDVQSHIKWRLSVNVMVCVMGLWWIGNQKVGKWFPLSWERWIEWRNKSSYRAHYRGILLSSSPAGISAWGSSASERTSGPGSDTASARTQISVQSKTQSSRIIYNTITCLCICQTVHIHVTWDTYFDKIFHFKRDRKSVV